MVTLDKLAVMAEQIVEAMYLLTAVLVWSLVCSTDFVTVEVFSAPGAPSTVKTERPASVAKSEPDTHADGLITESLGKKVKDGAISFGQWTEARWSAKWPRMLVVCR